MKILLIPLIAQIFFIQTFFEGWNHLTFMKKSIDYARLTASGDELFYGGLAVIQENLLIQQVSKSSLTSKFL